MKKQLLFHESAEPVCSSSSLSRRHFLGLVGAATSMWQLNLRAETLAESKSSSVGPAQLTSTHDLLSLPQWGPYSKKYFGISHIPDVGRGLSFDLSVFPLLTEGPATLPSVNDIAGVHPWEAAPDLDYYSLRLETMWKDQLYCDLSFSPLSSSSRLMRLELVNRTAAPKEVALNCLAQLVFPPFREFTSDPIRLYTAELPPGAVWVHALDYADLRFARPRPTDNLVPDGMWRGEERCHESVGGSVVGQGFGQDPGDEVRYRVHLDKPCSNAVLIWRFQMQTGSSVTLKVEGVVQREILFRGSGKFDTVVLPIGRLEAGDCEVRFTSLGGAAVILNGFALLEAERADQFHFIAAPWHPQPEIETLAAGQGMILKYQDVSNSYGFTLGAPLAGHRELKWRDLEAAFGTEAGPNAKERIFGNPRQGHAGDPDSLFIHAFSKPLTVGPNRTRVIYGVIAEGPDKEVHECLASFNPQAGRHENVYRSAREKTFEVASTPAGEGYKFSQQLMAATTLTNVVYPLHTQGNYIRHYSPGRHWDCLYTWDAGFSGFGLLELNVQGAVEILNAYTTPPDAQSAFIHHGSPVPVQIYLYGELWNRTQSRELLEYFYPRLRQYHRFLAGRLGSSTTRRHRDPLIATWNYFYNSGGWDDYSPQKFVHQHHLEATVTPVTNSAHAIRCAKLLRSAAEALGRTEDFAEYDQDIAELSAALQKYSWDAASGYFGYVTHDDNGEPSGILRTSAGVNLNMGLDGIYPLVAGICSEEQKRIILERVFSPERLWTSIGITTVDQSAPYFIRDGYWNGSVWLAHQWFLWKTMLDLGRADLALRIAQTGLDLWKHVTDSTYDCMEHFIPQEPLGRGWHQFTSLSSPVLPWFASLYTPGRLTCGFDVWVEQHRFSEDKRRLDAKLRFSSGARSGEVSVLASMRAGTHYRVLWNRAAARFTTVHDGLLQIQLPNPPGSGDLQVIAV